MFEETEYEKKIGELQEKTLICEAFATTMYLEMDEGYKKKIMGDIIENLRKTVQKVGWIDTRSFD